MKRIKHFVYTWSHRLAVFLYMSFYLSGISLAQSQYGSGEYFDKIKQITESGATPVKAGLTSDFESPVNTLTGAACFDIPIYTIETSNYRLPVTLHYETSGFKLVDIASNVGMGWNISAGGCITRTVKGLPDERANTGYCAQGHDADSIHEFLRELAEREDFDTLAQVPTQQDNSLFAALLDVTDNLIDAEPDIYSFSFAGYSGSFLYDMEGNIHMIPQQNYVVQRNNNGFVITVDNGDKYYFENGNAVERIDTINNTPLFEYVSNFETTNSATYYPNRYFYSVGLNERLNQPIAWHLTKIVLADSEQQIVFEYDSEAVRTYIGTDETYMMGQRFIERTNFQFANGHDWTVHRVNRYKYAHVPRLRRITWDTGSIDFIPSTGYREDLDFMNFNQSNVGGRSIDSIVVSSMSDQQNAREQFSIGLSHSYFLDENTVVQPPNGIPNDYRPYYKRLRLNAVTFYGTDEDHLYSYSFLYNSISSRHCPSRNSCEVDYWGYYKPRTSKHVENQAIKPKLFYYENGKADPLYNSVYSAWQKSGDTEPTYVLDGNDMTPEAMGSQEFTLQIVELPTGGRVVFNYELNDFWFDNQTIRGPGIRVSSVDYSGFGNTYSKTYTYRDGSTSSGRVSSIPDMGQFQLLPSLLYGSPTGSECDRINYLTARRYSTVTDMKGTSESMVNYAKVTERIANGNASMGRTVYYYELNLTAADSVLSVDDEVFVRKTKCRKSHAFNAPLGLGLDGPSFAAQHKDASPNFTYPNTSWYNGFLTRKECYDNNDKLLESVEYKYSLMPKNDSVFFIQAKFLERFITSFVVFDNNYGNNYELPAYQYDIVWGVNYHKTGTRQLDTIIHKRYDPDNGALENTSVKTLSYNNLNYVSSEQTVNSDGDTICQHYSYPVDFDLGSPNSLYWEMAHRNMNNTIIEQYTSVNNKVTNGTYYQYSALGGNQTFIKPLRVFTLRTAVPLLAFEPSNTQQGYDSHYGLKNEMEYDLSSGNIIELWDENLGTTTYVWGYNNSRIIAEIRNATATQVQNALTCSLDALNEKTDTEELLGIFSNLRTGLPQAMVTSYTYDMFLKILSVTDPSGRTQRYEYDTALRLKLTRDADNSILQKYDYHYRQLHRIQ